MSDVKHLLGAGGLSAANIIAGDMLRHRMALRHSYRVEAFRDGERLWIDEFDNLVVTVGRNEYLDKVYKASAYTASHFVMLTDGTPTFAAGDTMASHAGWVEVQTYSEAVRQTFTAGTVAAGSVDNSAAKAVFSINGAATVGGAAMTTVNTKGGTTGILMGGNAFTGGDRSLQNNDTLNVTVTASLTSS